MSNQLRKKEAKIKIDYSTAVKASDHEQCSDLNFITYYCKNARGEDTLCRDLIRSLPEDAKNSLFPKARK